mmetsp:Transcript_41638/g.40012  ORF Transcript_41638/g.40012 Transcript_41638/m.40012 type:complete len:120 (-) Transcript_41638:268-627(-)|eukprot:CAMPEP_0170564948 /NCGR_PEP_ID=MMETSP0211-20121228/75827_1 /TAXON_ID=311385 /ORGANISM="Pseudokeronopsis sp., Strain OXSARD2" /LENGTH=119 /DNA_ID=CAMNT_0010885101 /DNA_START=385 /DNA_END=744 /DNA_ORIENTATION=-
MLRIALKKYHSSGLFDKESAAVDYFMRHHIEKFGTTFVQQNMGWRQERFFNEGVDLVYKRFKPLLQEAYRQYSGRYKKPGEKSSMMVDEFEEFINDSSLCNDLLYQREVCLCFNLALMT